MRKFWIIAIPLLLAVPLVPFAVFGEFDGLGILDHPSPYYLFFIGILLLASDIIAPLPSSLVAVFLGTKLGLFYGTVSIFSGLMIGSLIGFGLGWYPGNVLAKSLLPSDQKTSIDIFEHRISYWVLVLCRSIPILAESSVIAAGTARLRPTNTFAVLALSNLLLAVVYAFFGVWGGANGSPAFLFCGGILVPAIGILLLFLFVRPSFLHQSVIHPNHDKNNHA